MLILLLARIGIFDKSFISVKLLSPSQLCFYAVKNRNSISLVTKLISIHFICNLLWCEYAFVVLNPEVKLSRERKYITSLHITFF